MSRRLAGLALVLLLAAPVWGQGAVRGFVTDASTGGALPGANVRVERLGGAGRVWGTFTDADGYYQIDGLAPGRYLARATFVGYRPVADTLAVAETVRWSVALAPDPDALDEVVVQGEASQPDGSAGIERIRPADLARVPTPDVAGDLATYLTSRPGVVTLGDRGGGLYVRGGTPSQNLVLVDGAPVYQPFHAVGFFSAFPEDLVGSVDFYAGGFGARYSGRVSSVVDVSVREGNYETLQAAASAGPFLVGGMAEGPIRRGQSSWLVSGRRSVIRTVAPVLVGQDVPIEFADVLVKTSTTGGDARCSATALGTWDRGALDAEADDAFLWWNGVLSGRCVVAPSSLAGRLDISASVSTVRNEAGPREGNRRERTSQATETRIAADLVRPVGRARVRVGMTSSVYATSFDLSEAFAQSRDDSDLLLGAAAYAEAQVPLGGGLAVTPGLAVVLRPYAFSVGLEPRFRAGWQPTGAGGPELSAAAGLYRQSLVGLVDERDAGSPFIAWAGPPPDVSETTAVHGLLGAALPVGRGLRLGAEAYVKAMRDLPVPIWSALAEFTTTLTVADVRSAGVDVRAEWAAGPATAQVAYGFGRTTYTAGQDNFGVWFGEPLQSYAPPHDRRHQVQAGGSLRVGEVDLAVRWQYGSGLPYTRPFGFDTFVPPRGLPEVGSEPGSRRVLFERPYNARLPEYHRLDLSAGTELSFGGAALDLQTGVINGYNRDNVFYYDVFRGRRVDQLPLVPYVSARLRTRR